MTEERNDMNSKAASLLFLRVSTGLLCVIWGLIRIGEPKAGIGVNSKYYGGILTSETAQYVWGGFLAVVGVLTILGLLRKYAYPLQAAVLCVGALAIWKYLLDPLGLYLLTRETSQVLFFPSLGIAAATLVLLVFKSDDAYALDNRLGRK
jgi:putative oxidoreductase